MEDIYIEPSEAGGETDNLSGRHLQAGAEAVLRSEKRIGGQNDNDQHQVNGRNSDRPSLPKKKTRKKIHREKSYLRE